MNEYRRRLSKEVFELLDEISLHEGQLVDEALREFVTKYNERIRLNNKEEIKVIHGFGSTGQGGSIRLRLRNLLQNYPDAVEFEEGELYDNRGVTVVYPKQRIPESINTLSLKLLDYCKTPKTKERIIGEFRGYRTEEIGQAMKALESQGRLHTEMKGKFRCYVATRG